jgi:protein TonB
MGGAFDTFFRPFCGAESYELSAGKSGGFMEPTNPMFGALVVTEKDRGQSRRKALTLPVSVAAHGALLGAVVLLPLLSSDPPPDPTGSAVRAFFVEPVVPPPAPPPPAKAPSAHPAPKPVTTAAQAFTPPVETPDQVAPEASNDFGLDPGVAGGVEGGVPGGVVGGIVGGLPEAPTPVQPVRVGGSIKEPKKLKNVDPVYPPIAARARLQGLVTLECLLSPDGRVAEVKVLRGIPLLDDAAIEAVKQWVFTPTLFNGVPVPAIMTVNVLFAL